MKAGLGRLEKLDGLRGVAAFAVLIFHLTPSGGIDLVPHAGLAVDFFFLLSGFVIAAAYEKRLARDMRLRDFVYMRLVRLYPLIGVAVLLGALGYYKLYDLGMMAILIPTGLLLIPTPLGDAGEGQPAMALNPPSWSLFWEFVVNCLFGVLAPRLTNRILGLLLAVAFGALAFSSYRAGGLNNGAFWSNFPEGGPRVLFSFFAGMALWRLRERIGGFRVTLPFVAGAVILAAIIAVPDLGRVNWLYDVGIVGIAFPLLLAASCGSVEGRLGGACRGLGDLSYPMYILQGGFVPHLRGLPGHLGLSGLAQLATTIVLAIAFCVFAWCVLKWYDEPVRAWLSPRRRGVPRPAAATAP